MHTHRGLDRLVNFSDAVVAIAITLLVLPLIDVLGAHRTNELPFHFLFVDHLGDVFGLVLSFAIIAVLWREHHRLFEHVRDYSTGLLWLNMLWLFAIAVVPVTTAVNVGFTGTGATARAVNAETIVVYVGAMALASLAQTAMALLLIRSPALQSAEYPVTEVTVSRNAVVAALFLAALLLGVFTPLGYYALFAQVLNGPIDALIGRISGRRSRLSAVRPAESEGAAARSSGGAEGTDLGSTHDR